MTEISDHFMAFHIVWQSGYNASTSTSSRASLVNALHVTRFVSLTVTKRHDGHSVKQLGKRLSRSKP